MARPGTTTIKTLFALSCNRCAYPGCDQRLADPQWGGVRADIAHIRGEKPGAARYSPEMSEKDRNSVDNLMLLCPNHHREVDRLCPQDWPADRLMEIKAKHGPPTLNSSITARCSRPQTPSSTCRYPLQLSSGRDSKSKREPATPTTS